MLLENQIREGLAVEPFTVTVEKLRDEWHVTWWYEGIQAGEATFLEVDEGVHWTRFNVAREWQNHGLYTQALRWSAEVGRAFIESDTGDKDFYLQAGFKEKDGMLVQDKRLSASWLKDR